MKLPLSGVRTSAEIAIELKPFWHEHEYDYPSFRECIFMALKEDFMYVNWDGRTFLSCQNDGVYILFSTLGARQNTLFLTPPAAAALEEYLLQLLLRAQGPFQFFIFIKLSKTLDSASAAAAAAHLFWLKTVNEQTLLIYENNFLEWISAFRAIEKYSWIQLV